MPELTTRPGRVLVLGYGNPGRGDDGLGPAFAAAVEDLGAAGVAVESDYQLGLEDAEAVARHQVVVFADADQSGPAPFSFRDLEPRYNLDYTSHHLEPAAVLALAQELFGGRPRAYVLGIRGYEFGEWDETLTDRARDNLTRALEFFKSWVCNI